MKKAIVLGLLMIAPAKLHWWTQDVSGDTVYMTRGTLGDHHDRVCGGIKLDDMPAGNVVADGWRFYTLRSGGAHKGVLGDVASFGEARDAVEKDCR